MNEFSVAGVASSGFLLMRDRPGALAVWVGVQLLLGVVVGGVVLAAFAPMLGPLLEAMGAGGAEAQTRLGELILQSLGKLIAVYLMIILFAVIVSVVINCAIMRATLRPEEVGLAYLRLGGDELRVFAATMGYGLMAIIGYALGIAVIALLGRLAGPVAPLVYFLGAVAFIAGLLFLVVRLSLVTVQTFFERRINLFGSWDITRGRFWLLAGAYLLTGLFVIGLSIFGGIINQIVSLFFATAAAGLSGIGGGQTQDIGALIRALAPVFVISLVINSIVGMLANVLIISAKATTFKTLRPGAQAEVF